MASDDLINQRLGQYEIAAVLGRGGMATVYLARQTSMDRDVAIKVMARELADDEQFIARFQHEAQVIARLQHPHILPVIDFGREGKNIYIVMRLVRGGSLDDRLKSGPLDLPLASRMLSQIASALTFAHEQGIIHRDLKPNNVLLDERDNAYLTDFGIAKMLAGTSKLTATGNILGTPAYMAPEQWRGEAVDARTDTYALGVVLYEMVLGQLPFSGDTPYTLMYKHFNDAPPPPRALNPDIHPAIEAVILKALAKEADARYQSTEAMAHDFAEAVRAVETGVGPAPVDGLEATVIGAEVSGVPVTAQRPAARPPDQASTLAPQTPAEPTAASRGGAPAPETPTPAPAPAAPPARRGPGPIMLGLAGLLIVAILGGGAYFLFGGGEDDPATETPVANLASPTEESTNTLAPPTDTDTPEPTATDTLTPTATVTDTPEPSPTATEGTTRATVLTQQAHVRRGPGAGYDIVATLQRDQSVLVIGVSEDGGWYEVAGGGVAGVGWISAETVRISGNPSIDVVIWPTDTPEPTATATDTPEPTATDTLTPTATATDTPEPSPTDTAEPVDPALFVPVALEPATLSTYGLSLDYPANWDPPQYLDSAGYAVMQPVRGGDLDRYPYLRLFRGTPAGAVEANFTTDSSSPARAIENTYAMVPGAHQVAEGAAFPTYTVNSRSSDRNNWAWLIEVAAGDWVYIIAHVPSGEHDLAFGEQVLAPMVNSLVIDGERLFAPESIDLALFLPTEYERASLDAIGVTLDYPVAWQAPTNYGFGVDYFLNAIDNNDPDYDYYPALVIGRGTPEDLQAANLATDISSPVAALESLYGADFTGMHRVVEDLGFPAYSLDQAGGETHVWAWLVELAADDWLVIVGFAPVGEYDQQFGDEVLFPIVTSVAVDGQPLVPEESTSGVNPALFVPTEFERVTLDAIGVALDYPAKWLPPAGFGITHSLLPVDSGDPLAGQYPTMVIARGAPGDLVSAGLTTDTSSPAAAVEHPLGEDFSGQSETVDTFAVPAYRLNMRDLEIHAWVWLFEVAADDWVYLIAVAPSGDFDLPFEQQTLSRMVTSLVVDDRPLASGEEMLQATGEGLVNIPLAVGDPILLDRFDDNANDWQFGTIEDGRLVMESPSLDFLRWAFPNTIAEAAPAFYLEVTGQVISDTNYYQYGLAFRVTDLENFYLFAIDHFQQYRLLSLVENEASELIAPTFSQAVNVGEGARNTLGVLVYGDYIELYVNGQPVAALTDDDLATGGVRVASYTFTDSNSPVVMAFDNFAYVPLSLGVENLLDTSEHAAVGTVVVDSSPVLTAPDLSAAPLATLNNGQLFAVLGRTSDSRFLLGYARGAVGWLDRNRVVLTRGAQPITLDGLPVVASTVQGLPVQVWPVAWPGEDLEPAPEATPSAGEILPEGTATLAYGQQAAGTLAESGMVTWTFTGTAGDVVTIGTDVGENTALDPLLTLIGPDGSEVARDDDGGPGLNGLIQNVALPSSGTYTIQVSAVRGDGPFTVSLAQGY